MVSSKHFDSVIAKNNIAREIRDRRIYKEDINASWIQAQLEIIEQYTGELNQPSVSDILEDDEGVI